MNKSKLLITLLLTLILFATGCMNYKEEVWLNKNGSGKITLHFNSSVQSLIEKTSEDINTGLKTNKKLSIIDQKLISKADSSSFTITISFKEISDLDTLNDIGTFSFVEGKKAKPVYTRTLTNADSSSSIEKPKPGEIKELMRYKWEYIAHLPYPIDKTNAQSLDKHSNTVSWKYNYYQILQNKRIVMTATMKKPIPILVLLLITVVLLVIMSSWIFVNKPRKPLPHEDFKTHEHTI